MKKVTSFISLNTGEGSRISYTYSEISDSGKVISQNNKGNFLVMDEAVQEHVDEIRKYIQETFLS